MKIELTQTRITIVDDEDYERVMSLGSWHEARGYAVHNIHGGGGRIFDFGWT